MKNNICLIGDIPNPSAANEYWTSSRSLGIALLASCLRNKGFSTDIIDPFLHEYSVDDCLNIIKQNDYDYFGFSVLVNFEKTKELIIKLRKAGYKQHFVMGGVYATTNYYSILTQNHSLEIDSIIVGEGEEAIVELIENLINNKNWKEIKSIAYFENGTVHVNQRRDRISNLDLLPFQATDDIKTCIEKNMPISMYTSRGCPGTCLYCGSSNLLNDTHNTWLSRSPENVIDELKLLKGRFNVNFITFIDDNFIGTSDEGTKRVLKICNMIINENLNIRFFMQCRPDVITNEVAGLLYAAGCRSIFLGIESASNERLKELGRGTLTAEINQKAIDTINANGIEPAIGFIMFTPDMTMKDCLLNLDFLDNYITKRFISKYKTQGVMYLMFSELIPFSGTLMRKKLEKQFRVIDNNANYLITDPDVWLLKMIIKEHGLDTFLYALERKIRSCWFNLNYSIDISIAKKIRSYETTLAIKAILIIREIIQQIETRDLSSITKTIISFKKDALGFSNKSIKEIKTLLENT
jgi:radical SAM superfamily enzyme YgiQ (UPF0313 family)